MSAKVTPADGAPRRPIYWDKMVAYAYLRMMGTTQEDGAKSVGRSRRTVQLWESEDPALWQAARFEARDRWMGDAEDAARRAVLRSLEMGNSELGKWMLERIDPRMAPPKQKLEHTGKDGGPVETASRVVFYIPNNGRDGDA